MSANTARPVSDVNGKQIGDIRKIISALVFALNLPWFRLLPFNREPHGLKAVFLIQTVKLEREPQSFFTFVYGIEKYILNTS